MSHLRRFAILVPLLFALLAPVRAIADTDDGNEPMRILAASSLTGPMTAIAEEFETEDGIDIQLSFGGSSKLATQITQGAEADVFLSANRRWVDHLADSGHVVETSRTSFASNRLVWVLPASAEGGPETLDAVRQSPPDQLALGNANVPAGIYARQALEEAGIWSALQDRVISAENVKRALQWVALGEADAGIVYESDAVGSDRVRVGFQLPDTIQPDIVYEGAVIADARHSERARDFLDHLKTTDARRILRDAGFSSVHQVDTQPAPSVSTGDSVDEASAIHLSLIIGLACVVGGLLPAILLGWLLARAQFRGKSVLATLLLAPLALPPVVTGFVLLRLFGQSGLFGPILTPLGIEIPFTTLGAGMAAFVVAFPLYLLTARSAFELVDRRYEEVSKTLGYRPTVTFWRVTIPLALPGIAAGALLAFARAIGEFGATAVLAGNVKGETQTIPLAIYTMLESPSGVDAIWLLVGISVGLSLVAVMGFEWFNRRQRQRLHAE